MASFGGHPPVSKRELPTSELLCLGGHTVIRRKLQIQHRRKEFHYEGSLVFFPSALLLPHNFYRLKSQHLPYRNRLRFLQSQNASGISGLEKCMCRRCPGRHVLSSHFLFLLPLLSSLVSHAEWIEVSLPRPRHLPLNSPPKQQDHPPPLLRSMHTLPLHPKFRPRSSASPLVVVFPSWFLTPFELVFVCAWPAVLWQLHLRHLLIRRPTSPNLPPLPPLILTSPPHQQFPFQSKSTSFALYVSLTLSALAFDVVSPAL